jgi:hypothetical protein
MRLGNRPNEGRAEVSTCVRLPDGRTACRFDRVPISGNEPAAGGQRWSVERPFAAASTRFEGEVHVLEDPWALTDPKTAFTTSEVVGCHISLHSTGLGLGSVLGADQADVGRIFLPGQADHHYQHLVHTTGTVEVGEDRWRVDGLGGRDHSWGPRHWHAKLWFRWLIGAVDDGMGFMLTRGVGPDAERRGGFLWADGTFRLVDTFELRSGYGGPPHYPLRGAEVLIRAGRRTVTASATPITSVPLRHIQTDPGGQKTVLRIVKSPALWTIGGIDGAGMLEYHDRLHGGVPLGLEE